MGKAAGGHPVVVGAALLGALFVGTAVLAAAAPDDAPRSSGSHITACEEMQHLWSGAHEINYDADARTVTFVWEDGQAAMLRDTDPGCDSQPRLEGQLRGSRNAYLANEKASCQELRNLVDAVKEERKAEGTSTSGRVPVSDAAAEKAARKNPKTAWLADSGKLRELNHALGPRTIDLDGSEQVLATCPR
ncbi:MAG: hypothetical protein ACRDZ3_04260 [Acidimicrobiia bacterium]